jgi:hypothetical protein
MGHALLSECASLQRDQYYELKLCPAFSFPTFIIEGGDTCISLNVLATLEVLQISVNAHSECRIWAVTVVTELLSRAVAATFVCPS